MLLSPPIALIGPTGAGKSTVGLALAKALNWCFVDLDVRIEEGAGASISEIFTNSGEAGFRAVEEAALIEVTELARTTPIVCATGGGIVTTPTCVELLMSHWMVIALRAAVDTQVVRLLGNTADRPLLAQSGDLTTRLRTLAQVRDNLYQEAAHQVIEVDLLSPDEVVDAILACL